MDVKGANPFLFTEDDYTSPNSANSNPFLMGGDDFMDNSGGDNPFLSQTATTVASNSTNPFAFDPVDMGPQEAFPAEITSSFQTNFASSNAFVDTMAHMDTATNIFTTTTTEAPDFLSNSMADIPVIAPQKPTDLDLKYTTNMDSSGNSIINDVNQDHSNGLSRPLPPRPPPSKETQDLLMSVMGAMDATSSHLLDRIPPTRTPSPVSMRDLHSPSPTPEPATQDLLDVGDSLMSTEPSNFEPKQMSHSEDLLMSMGQENDINQNPPLVNQTLMQNNQNIDIMNQTDMLMNSVQQTNIQNASILNQTPPSHEVVAPIQPPIIPTASPAVPEQNVPVAHVPPQRPGPPIRPPRPTPPQKPPPPAFGTSPVAESNNAVHFTQQQPPNTVASPSANGHHVPPPKPPPPAVPARVSPPTEQAQTQDQPQIQPQTQQTQDMEMFDMFGVDNVPAQKPIASTADIMSLYKMTTSKPEPQVTDLLCDTIETTMISELPAEDKKSGSQTPVSDVFGTSDSLHETTPSSSVITEICADASTPIVQDNFISPEPSQPDLQMDTSDSQSKGSVSSVTFNPFAATEDIMTSPSQPATNAFQQDTSLNLLDNSAFQQEPAPTIFGVPPVQPHTEQSNFGFGEEKKTSDEFDAFTAKFESAKDENKNGVFDAFSGSEGNAWGNEGDSGFGDASAGFGDSSNGFGGEETFDAFLAMKEPPAVPQSTPNKINKAASQDSDEDKDFSVFIKPKSNDDTYGKDGILPVLAPPPAQVAAFSDNSPRFNPFDLSENTAAVAGQEMALPFGGPELTRTDSQETPPTPLYDEDMSQPLEPFPRLNFQEDGWEMQLRQPNKKKITGQRFWKKIFVKLQHQPDCVLLQLFNQPSDKDPFQELPLQPCYSVSEIGAQQYDNFGKIFTLKLQYIFYKERPGVRPGQVKKAERITNKLSQFAAYAIQGDYQGVKEFGSDLKKLGLPVEHAPQVSQLMKLGSLNYEDLKQFSVSVEEALFKLQAHRDRALHYKMEEVQITAVDELYVEQNSEGHVEKQIARVRLFFLGFLTGMPDVELGINDMRRQGKEVVGRHDIIPVVTEEWIRLEDVEFHSCVQQDEYEKTHIIKFKPPDACYIELLRFRVRPPKNRELPLQLKPTICITGNKVELRADVLVPGFASRKLGQVPCEDVMIRFPIPECWIYMFRVEKHFRYGSVKSAHRRTGKIKGIERILGTVDNLQESLIEVTSGQAKYEHQHRAIVWRCPRLPKEGQGAYTTHNMVCRLALTSYDQMPDQLAEYCYVEFTMPATQVSHTTCRSVSLQNSDSDDPPEKYVRYLARHEYRVGIEHTEGDGPGAYTAATVVKTAPVPEEPPKPIPEADDSSSDSD